jgi:hypothetical protein
MLKSSKPDTLAGFERFIVVGEDNHHTPDPGFQIHVLPHLNHYWKFYYKVGIVSS